MTILANLRRTLSTTKSVVEITTAYRQNTSPALIDGHWAIKVTNTPVGTLYVHPQDYGVSRPLYVGQPYEAAETEQFRKLIKPGHTVLDIGANIGYTVRIAANLVGPSGRVLAIEPEADNLRFLKANTKGLKQVTICPYAVGSAPGTAYLSKHRWNKGGHRLYHSDDREQVEVPVKTIDQLASDHHIATVHFIKMDVEGYEPHVLKGMLGTLTRDHPIMLTEFWPDGMRVAGGDPEEFLSTLHQLGYHAHMPTGERIATLSDAVERINQHDPGGNVNLIFAVGQPHRTET